MDNGIMKDFFRKLKVEMYYGEKFESHRGILKSWKNTYRTKTTREFLQTHKEWARYNTKLIHEQLNI